jgi:hypothetical protein
MLLRIVSIYLWAQEVVKEIRQNQQNVPHVARTNSGRWFAVESEVLEDPSAPFCEGNKALVSARQPEARSSVDITQKVSDDLNMSKFIYISLNTHQMSKYI